MSYNDANGKSAEVSWPMMTQIYEAIEQAVSQGIPPHFLATTLIRNGWPPAMVNEALNAWMLAHGRQIQKTEFRQWLKKYRRRAMPSVMTVVAVSIVSSSIMLLKPWPIKIMVDSVFGDVPAPGPLEPYGGTTTLLLITSLLTVVIFLMGALFGTLRDFVALKLSFRLNHGIKSESLRHILHLPLYHKERLAKGDYIYRQNSLTSSLGDLVLDTTASIAQSVIMIVGIMAIMFSFNPALTIISVVVVPFLFVIIRYFGPQLGKISRSMTQLASKSSSTITEAIDNSETVQSYNLEDKQLSRASQLWQETHNLTRRGLLWGRLYRSSNGLLIIVASAVIMYLGGTAALNKEITLGELLIFMTYMGYLLGPVESLAMQIATRNQKILDVSRVYDVLSDHENIENLRRENHFPISFGKIEFQNVSYSYGDTVVLKNINLAIEPSQKVGVIGPSGSGKSTLLKLLPLFVEPTGGRIMVDNIDIQTVSLKELRQSVAWISQSPQLFSGTIIENLQDGNTNRQVNAPEIEEAINVSNVDEFTKRLPMGLNTMAGEGGSSLSGGQKQRIAIARGLIKNAPILCMDEPTAALDSRSEQFIRNSISKMIDGKTVLLVTHRLALLSLMDIVYVLEDGELKNVANYGGLEAYLQKISGVVQEQQAPEIPKADEEAAAQQAAEQSAVQQQRLAALEAENSRLQQKSLGGSSGAPDGTIYIEH